MLTMFLTVLLFVLPCAFGNYPNVFSGEHFVDIMTPPEDDIITDKAGILLLYQPKCEHMITIQWLNMEQHLVFLMHDYVTAPKHIWYKYREEDDLHKKYAGPDYPCFTALYFAKGTNLEAPTEVWSPEKAPLKDWVWSKLEVTVSIMNDLNEMIVVMQEPVADGPVLSNTVIGPNQKLDIKSYLSYTLRMTKVDYVTPVFAAVVTKENPMLRIHSPRLVDITPARDQENEDQEFMGRWIWSHADRLLKIFKQPLLIVNFTQIGYYKRDMPKEVFTLISDFYHQRRLSRESENFQKADAVIDTSRYEAHTTMVELSNDIRDKIESYILPILEEFCNCKLKRSVIYGIREYYKGHVLRNHVDRIATHVIGAILQVDQDLGGEEDWLLEVIDYNGDRKRVKLLPGEMLVYEASKLIHGRPTALKGKWYANIFMHYAPVNWDYKANMEEEFYESKSHGIKEPMTTFLTPLTTEKKLFKYQIKDEL